MHELAITTAILDTVARHAAGRRVRVVTVRVGALRQVVPESLEFYFDLVSRDGICDGARLEQVFVPARLACADCDCDWELDEPDFRCPSCGQAAAVVGGEELEVESIEVEEDQEACTASR